MGWGGVTLPRDKIAAAAPALSVHRHVMKAYEGKRAMLQRSLKVAALSFVYVAFTISV